MFSFVNITFMTAFKSYDAFIIAIMASANLFLLAVCIIINYVLYFVSVVRFLVFILEYNCMVGVDF